MNGNWGGIASRDFERIRDDHNDYDPSLDVINTIVSYKNFKRILFFNIKDRLIRRFKC